MVKQTDGNVSNEILRLIYNVKESYIKVTFANAKMKAAEYAHVQAEFDLESAKYENIQDNLDLLSELNRQR